MQERLLAEVGHEREVDDVLTLRVQIGVLLVDRVQLAGGNDSARIFETV